MPHRVAKNKQINKINNGKKKIKQWEEDILISNPVAEAGMFKLLKK